MMKTLQVGLEEILRKLNITISKSTQYLYMVCFQNSKLEVLGVQLRGLRVFNLCLDESNLVLF